MFNVSMLGAFGAYFSQFCSFVEFRRKYKNSIKRSFVSPLGIPGAVFGCVVFGLCFVSVCGFQVDQSAIIVFVLYLAAVSVYYRLVVMHRYMY
jgi:ethanolamine permease